MRRSTSGSRRLCHSRLPEIHQAGREIGRAPSQRRHLILYVNIRLTAPTAPGVTHKFTNVPAFNKEAKEARIGAGFHCRFSTVLGSDMGWKIGAYTVQNCMQPLKMAAN